MPGKDGTGPLGTGPRYGRGSGFCRGGNGAYGAFIAGFGGRGPGFRRCMFAEGLPGRRSAGACADGYAVPESRDAEIARLKRQSEYLTGMLESINRRISSMDTAE